jgi:hypothetical protein
MVQFILQTSKRWGGLVCWDMVGMLGTVVKNFFAILINLPALGKSRSSICTAGIVAICIPVLHHIDDSKVMNNGSDHHAKVK